MDGIIVKKGQILPQMLTTQSIEHSRIEIYAEKRIFVS